jgi:vacuolar-type H+-ATPase subunit E/Vma4
MDKISKKIISDAKQKVKFLKEDFQKQLSKLKAEHQNEVENLKVLQNEQLDKTKEKEFRKLIALSNLQLLQRKLTVKRNLLDSLAKIIFEKVVLNENIYKKFIFNKIKQAVYTDNETLVICKEDKEKYQSEITEILKTKTKIIKIETAKNKKDVKKGEVYIQANKIIYNGSLWEEINDFINENEPEISKLVFESDSH